MLTSFLQWTDWRRSKERHKKFWQNNVFFLRFVDLSGNDEIGGFDVDDERCHCWEKWFSIYHSSKTFCHRFYRARRIYDMKMSSNLFLDDKASRWSLYLDFLSRPRRLLISPSDAIEFNEFLSIYHHQWQGEWERKIQAEWHVTQSIRNQNQIHFSTTTAFLSPHFTVLIIILVERGRKYEKCRAIHYIFIPTRA